jgi:hypothetical protein
VGEEVPTADNQQAIVALIVGTTAADAAVARRTTHSS